jgi:ABC-type uncharacterized transport system auxiliary subunit
MQAKKHTISLWVAAVLLAMIIAGAAGCNLPGSKPHIMVKQWTLEFKPPQPSDSKLPASLKVMRFQAAQAVMGNEMFYRPGPNERGAYNYNRWMVGPSDLVGDFLLRDLRAEGTLAAVFSNRQPQRPRFRLEGGVEEFLEVDSSAAGGGSQGGDAWHAALKVNLTLLDIKQDDVTKRLLFQRNYTFTSKMPKKDPAGLAEAMSQAMAEFSAQARSDIYEAIEKALKRPLRDDSKD